MAARAMWKGVIAAGEQRVPVKLYSAVEDRNIHFRLLHDKDRMPLRQQMINPVTERRVPYEDVHKGYEIERGRYVMFAREELDALEPPPARDIEVLNFVAPEAISHLWYLRPYWLGPDGSEARYFALVEALAAWCAG